MAYRKGFHRYLHHTVNGQPSPNQVHTALIKVLLFLGSHQIRERQATTGVKSLHASFNVMPASVKQTKCCVVIKNFIGIPGEEIHRFIVGIWDLGIPCGLPRLSCSMYFRGSRQHD